MKTKENKTALITGASSGIGKVFAEKLAALGWNLILVARRKALLEKLAVELNGKYLIKVEVFSADLSQIEDIKKLEKLIIHEKNLQMLVNNAGFGVKVGSFVESDIEKQTDMINVHITATMRLCRTVLPVMLAQKKGYIINVSSIAAFAPIPEGINYGATKNYIVSLSEWLQIELKGTNIKVQALCPGFTYTGFHDTEEFEQNHRSRKPKMMWSSAEKVVEESLRALKRNKVIIIPGLKNRIMVKLCPMVKPLIIWTRK